MLLYTEIWCCIKAEALKSGDREERVKKHRQGKGFTMKMPQQ